MSTSLIESYAFASKQVIIYVGSTIFITGVIGAILNIIVFLSLQTFRQSSCAFYLTIMSLVDIGYLCINVLPRLLITMFNIDATTTSLFYCKFQTYFSTTSTVMAMTCFCLATMDQYCATCSRPRFQQWCNLKLAQRLVIIFSIIWILHSIPYLILFYHGISSSTGKVICTMTNSIYIQYRGYFIVLILFGCLPVSISMLFGCMAFINIQQLAHYTIPLVRRELDKQLTSMVLAEFVFNCFVQIPFITAYAIQLNPDLTRDPFMKAQIQLAYSVIQTLSYLYFSTPFYIYICASERFRRQLIYVLFKVHLNRCKRQQRVVNNHVVPQT